MVSVCPFNGIIPAGSAGASSAAGLPETGANPVNKIPSQNNRLPANGQLLFCLMEITPRVKQRVGIEVAGFFVSKPGLPLRKCSFSGSGSAVNWILATRLPPWGRPGSGSYPAGPNVSRTDREILGG